MPETALLLSGGLAGFLGEDLAALVVGGAAFPFDVLIQLLAHGCSVVKREIVQSAKGESSAGADLGELVDFGQDVAPG